LVRPHALSGPAPQGCNLTGATLWDQRRRLAAKFEGADLAGAVLREAVMNGEQLRAHVGQYVL
jgi:uncharacterized protein YjbI with pentapeptide repeats